MKNTLETRLGIFFAVALVAIAVVLEMAGSFDAFRRGVEIQARFNDVLELRPADPVKMAGKQIGIVSSIEFAGDKVLVRMKITDPTAVIRTDSKATIKFSGLLGQNYVAIDFGTPKGAPITTGSELATVDQPDVGQILAKLDGVADGMQRLTDNLSDINFEELIVPFTDFLKQSGPDIENILSNTADVVAQVRSGKGAIGRLIYEDTFYTAALESVTNLTDTTKNIQSAVTDARAVVDDLRKGQGTLGKLLTDEKLYSDTSDAMTQLKEILQKINRGEGSVGQLVNDPTLIDNANLTLRKVDKATETLEDQGPLTVLGILINPLF